MKVSAPPISDKIVDEDGNISIPWILFFNGLYNGDTGTIWTPTWSSLTEVGGASTSTGLIYRIGQRLAYFTAIVTPVTNTSSIAGTTYISNFPLTLSANGTCLASAGVLGSTGGMCVASSNRIYTPGWTTIATPVTIAGVVEAR